MSPIMTPEGSKEACESIHKQSEQEYKEIGLSRKKYREEIVGGALLPWKHYGPKAKCLEWYREEVGIKPAEKLQIETEKPILVITDRSPKPEKAKKKNGNSKTKRT